MPVSIEMAADFPYGKPAVFILEMQDIYGCRRTSDRIRRQPEKNSGQRQEGPHEGLARKE
jgi:hypothetical protein